MVIDKFPTKSLSWNRVGDACRVKGDYDRVIETLKNAVDKFPIELNL